uniref:Uncharacterized protein n=1 Tax=Tanacetum cinerariifolium TaxID=118510 RepID=A0A6L2MRI5_TANCI|nr:hypothetical protein [Tanacetum cinerariifolium]
MTLPSWDDAKVAEEPHHLSLPLLEHVPSHTTALAAKEAMIMLPTPNETVASLPDTCLAKKSKAGSSTLELGQAEGVDEADLIDFYAEIENSLERDEGTSVRAASTPTPRLGKRLGAPPSMADVSAYGPSYGRTLVHASTSGHGLCLGGAVVSGYVGKSEAEVLGCRVDPLDSLSCSALDRDVEYDRISEDDFVTATRGEEINLTLFPLAPGPYQMSYPYKGASSPSYTREEWNGHHVLKGLVSARNRFHEKFDQKTGYVKELHTELTDDRVASIGLLEELSQTYTNLSDQALVVRDLHNQLALGWPDLKDIWMLWMGITHRAHDVEFEAAVQKFSNFYVYAKVDFKKALVDFPATPFSFLNKMVAASR